MMDVLLQFLEAELLLSSLPDVEFYVRCQCSDGACIVSGINQLLLIFFYGHRDLGLGAARRTSLAPAATILLASGKSVLTHCFSGRVMEP